MKREAHAAAAAAAASMDVRGSCGAQRSLRDLPTAFIGAALHWNMTAPPPQPPPRPPPSD